MDARFALIGLIIGFLIGLTGMGGGSLMTPVMILIMGVKPLIAVGTDLAYGAVTRIVGGAMHHHNHTVHYRTAGLLALGSVPATIGGVGVIAAIRTHDPQLVNGFLLHAIAWVLILVAVLMIAKPGLERAAGRWGGAGTFGLAQGVEMLGERAPWALPIAGAVTGFLVGLTSVGTGTLIIIALLFLYPRWRTRELVGTDVFHGAVLVSAASMAQLAAGNVNLSMMASLLVGSIPGVLVGSRLTLGFPEGALRLCLASVLLVSGAKLL
jgi:uncharacterized membrane protein YfcA